MISVLAVNSANRCWTNCRRRSFRETHNRRMPAKIGKIRKRKLVAMSACRDSNSFEQLLFESILRRANHEIGSQPTRLKRTLDIAGALALVLENENVACADDLAFHAADLTDALDPPNPIAHTFDMHEDVDGAGDLRAERSKR